MSAVGHEVVYRSPEANLVWESWIPPRTAPARACVQAVQGADEFAVEIAAVVTL
jgi:hypothetical protein